MFAGASTLYLHGYVSKAARIRGEEMGAWSFVAGSVGVPLGPTLATAPSSARAIDLLRNALLGRASLFTGRAVAFETPDALDARLRAAVGRLVSGAFGARQRRAYLAGRLQKLCTIDRRARRRAQ